MPYHRLEGRAMTASERETILRIEHITKRFPLEDGKVLTACNDVTFPVYR